MIKFKNLPDSEKHRERLYMYGSENLSNEEFSNEYEANVNVAEKPGTVLLANEKKGLFIKTTDGVLSVLEIQGENAKRMNVSDFLRGNKIEVGEIFV